MAPMDEMSNMQYQKVVGSQRLSDVPKQGDLFDQYRQAAERYHAACRDAQRASMEKAQAEKVLADLTAQVQSTIQTIMLDPTVPQNPQASTTTPGNGRW